MRQPRPPRGCRAIEKKILVFARKNYVKFTAQMLQVTVVVVSKLIMDCFTTGKIELNKTEEAKTLNIYVVNSSRVP